MPLDKIQLPLGFRIDLYTGEVPRAREMVFSPQGILFAGSFEGNVYAIVEDGKGGKARRVVTIAKGLRMPVGVDFRNGSLYVSAIDRILRYDNIESRLDNPPKPVTVNGSFPKDRPHGWKFIRFGPDGMLYVPVGAPCNVCLPKDERYATIMRMQPDGTGLEIFARGIRNTVGFDWHPVTGDLWFTDNGRDGMGDNIPPDELNYAPRKGMHFGFPFLHGKSVADPEFAGGYKGEITLPAMELGPHVAALGMRFYTGRMFPREYGNQIFIAEHGSWDRSEKIGYRVMLVRLEGNKAVSYEVFAQGWLQGQNAWGRPVDVQVAPDGALLVSDDKAGAIYRISYEEGTGNPSAGTGG